MQVRHTAFRKRTIGALVDFVYSCDEAITMLDAHEYTDVFLDHDLKEEHYKGYGMSSGTGFDVVRWIVLNTEKFKNTLFYIHSLNVEGRKRMLKTLEQAGLKAIDAPYAWEKVQFTPDEDC